MELSISPSLNYLTLLRAHGKIILRYPKLKKLGGSTPARVI
jgi:hypothetical protein